MSAFRNVLVAVLLGVTAAAAAPTSGVAQEGPTADVVVTNSGDSGVHVYVLQEGHMVPVGFLEAGATETLDVPPVFLETGEPVQLLADRVQSTEWFKSEPVAVEAGSEIRLTVEPAIDRSSVTVGG